MCLIFLFSILSILSTQSIQSKEGKNFRIMFYNVENLFDTYDNPLKDDDDFLPEGFMRWNSWKYWDKLRNIARVITAVGGMESPALVGLCEIETDSILYDLTKRSPLRAQEYAYIITNSPDERGMNVGLLYQRDQFKPLQVCEYEVRFGRKGIKPTRNLLHVVGKVLSGDSIDVFVCHFPSRSGGQRETEPSRLDAAALLRSKADSVCNLRDNAYIVIMGDFNDTPNNKSISKILGAKSIHEAPSEKGLHNLFLHRTGEEETGTYKYRGKWEILDQFIVSGNLLSEKSSIHLRDNTATIFNADFLLEDDEKYYGKKPYRTNLGPRYLAGFSDHLPIYVDITVALSEQ